MWAKDGMEIRKILYKIYGYVKTPITAAKNVTTGYHMYQTWVANVVDPVITVATTGGKRR
jgi:hypothetical protein